MRKFLTDRQRVVFNFVRQKIYEGLPPTVREVAAHLGVTGKAAYDHLWAIRKKGYIHWQDYKPRTLSLLPPYKKDDTRYLFVVDTDIPHLNINKGDYLHIDAGKPAAEGDMIVSTQSEIKRFAAGDVVFGKVVRLSREIQA